MGTIERQTLEEERALCKSAIKIEEEAIAAGDLSLGVLSAGDPDFPISRREHLLELQARLASVESRLASEELSV